VSDPLIAELRGRFRESTRTRVATMQPLLDTLERNPEDADALRELMRHFHFFAGMGTTCGFPAVSAIADEGEADVHRFVSDGVAPGIDAIAAWRVLVARIEQEVSPD
jgi:chemotaxis protein histidine kinase CheA